MIALSSQPKGDTKLLWYELPEFCLLMSQNATFLKLGDGYLCDLMSEKDRYIRPPSDLIGADFRTKDLRKYEYKTLDPRWIKLSFTKEETDGVIKGGGNTYPPRGQIMLVPMDESFFLCMFDHNYETITFGYFKGDYPFVFVKPHKIRDVTTMLCVSLDIAIP